MVAVARVRPGAAPNKADMTKYRRVHWIEAQIAILREIVPLHGIDRAATILGITGPTIRKKIAELGDITIGGRRRARPLDECADELRTLWRTGVGKRVMCSRLKASRRTLDAWVDKLDLPPRLEPKQPGGCRRAAGDVKASDVHWRKPSVTQPCYYAPTCTAIIVTVRGGPRMCNACQTRVAGY